MDPSVIESVGKIHLHGAFAGLTVEVQTSDGPKFLKVIDGLSLAATAQGHVIQNALARQNLAPQVTGYLSPKDVKALLRKFPELDEGDADVKLTYGVLMDRLDSASSRVGLNETPPSTWSKSDLEDTVRTLEATMAKLRIFPPQDLQFTFDRSGQFWLYDFDAYGHVSKSGAVTNLDSPKGDRTLEDFIRNRYIEVLVESKKRPTDRFFVDSAGHFRVRLERLRHQLFEMPLN